MMAAMGAPRPNIVIPERTEPALGLAVPDVVAAGRRLRGSTCGGW